MSGPGVYDFTIRQGGTFSRRLTWKDDAGAPINLTGFTARMQIRTPENGSILLSLTTENGGIVLGGVAGTITLAITAAATAALDWVYGRYDLELISAGGEVTPLLEGRVILDREVTR